MGFDAQGQWTDDEPTSSASPAAWAKLKSGIQPTQRYFEGTPVGPIADSHMPTNAWKDFFDGETEQTMPAPNGGWGGKGPDVFGPQGGGGDLNAAFGSITQGWGSGDTNNHTPINNLINALNQQGFSAQGGGIDGQGRQDSIMVNGKTYRVFNSSGQWGLTEDNNGSAWPDSGPGGGGGGGMTGGWRSPQGDNFFNMLMGRASQSEQINPNDPIIRNQADAYGAQQERSKRNFLQQIAERAGPGANISAETRAANERAGTATSDFTAGLMGRELTARRDEIQNALTQMGAYLSDQQRMALQEELANMNDQLQRSYLGQSAYQYDTNRQDKLGGF